jgi:hypothetical protein
MKYQLYNYIYPPRPANAVPVANITDYDNGSMFCQPKMNGSNCTIYTDGNQFVVMNRHSQRLTNFRINKEELSLLYKEGMSGWLVLNGEYLNKSKTDETGQVFNHKLIIFDILVYNSDYLVGKTFQERIQLLDTLYGQTSSEKNYLFSITPQIYRVKSFTESFSEKFNELTERGSVVEGIVMKRKGARLEVGNTPSNNSRSQIKCRVQTKNYRF